MENNNIKIHDFIYDQHTDRFGFITKFYTGADGSAMIAYRQDSKDGKLFVAPISQVTFIDVLQIVGMLQGIPPIQMGERVKLAFTNREGRVVDAFFNDKNEIVYKVMFGEVALFTVPEMLERDIKKWKMMS